MGFGSGYSSRTKRGGKSYSNEMCAHVWNAGEESEGQSSNGNLYFRGAAIYSYGSHFVLAYRMPDGVVFVNADSYSVTTSGHQSDVNAAIRDRRTVRVAGLTNLAGDWKSLPRLAQYLAGSRKADQRKEIQATVRAALLSHAAELTAMIREPGADEFESYYAADGVTWLAPAERVRVIGTEAGAYLAALVGLPLATWTKAKRDAATAKAKAEAAKAAEARDLAERRALRLADMSPRDFRDLLNRAADRYNDSELVGTGKELKRARGLMLAAKRGKLASKSRLAIVRDRIKTTAAFVATYAERHAKRQRSETMRRHLATVRNWRDASDKAAALSAYNMRELSAAGEYLATYGRTSALRAAGAALNDSAHTARLALETEAERARRLAEAERAAEAERRKAEWLAGSADRRGMRFDAATGGAALRVVGDMLETSHGAEVPLAHAVKVFRFIKLCRETGKAWNRNGVTIRVGHFQVDSISASGDFKAGCHNFTWPEVERVAIAAGVFDCPPSTDAVTSSAAAA